MNQESRDRVDPRVARPNPTAQSTRAFAATTHRSVAMTDWAVAGCAAIFVAILAISAYWDPTIRTLHVFEAIPYTVAGLLCLRQNKLGYALAIAGGAFWLWCAGFLTTFVRNGFQRLDMLVRTGSVDRLDVLIAAPAALATGGLVVFSIASYVRLRDKSWRDSVVMASGLVAVPLFFLAIFKAFAPRYLAMFNGIFW